MATLLVSLIDVEGLTDSPMRKTVSAVGIEGAGITDYVGEIRKPGAILDAVGITDTVSVTKMSLAPIDPIGVTDTPKTYVKALTGVDPVGLTDLITVVTGSAQTHTRSITDSIALHDLDNPEQQGWTVAPFESINITDTIIATVQTGSGSNPTVTLVDSMDNVDVIAVFRGATIAADDTGLTDTVSVVQTANSLFTVSVIDDTGLTDADGLGNPNVLVSRVQMPYVADELISLRDSLVISHQSGLAIFRGPTTSEAPAGGDPLFYYYSLDRGITVLQDINGVWQQVRFPTSEQLAAALRVYRGGYEYPISDDEAAALTAAGYGAYLTYPPAIVTTVAENPAFVPIPAYAYGDGPYGAGPYGG